MNLKAKVLDSWAMLAFFENEKSALDVDKILIESQKLGFPLFMSVINLGVIWYSTLRGYSETVAQQIIQEIFGLGIQIIDSDWPLVKQAATFKARGRISYADCFAAALAKRETAELVTGDLEFKQLEDEIKIIWLKN